MAAREQSGQNIDQGVIQRVITGVRYAVTGIKPTSFFSAEQPLRPVAQEAAEGRLLDFPVGYNQRQTPRGEEAISFAQLRGMADGYDLLRLVIETRKDQVASFEWELVPREKDETPDKYAADIKRVSDFLQSPDKERGWDQWLRMQLEDLLVIDAIAVYPRMTRGGEGRAGPMRAGDLYAFELVDPALLKRVIDDNGRTPLPPDPAYQQVLKGLPAVNYSRDQLVYTMRNPRSWKLYGHSPVEQVLSTVNIALRRQMTQMAHYTEGNVPEALSQVPAAWTMKQITDFQTWWDSVMEGNLAQKRKMRFLPNLDNIVFPKAAVLKDEYDEWLARIVCFAFSISPSALIKQVNRASGEQMADTAREEGLFPLLRFVEGHLTGLIGRYLGAPGLRFRFKVLNKVDPKAQAEIHSLYVDRKVLTPDEIREDIGREKMTPAEREAAFPEPVMEAAEPEAGVEKPKAEAPAKESAAEKMLADAIRMLDPSKVAEAIEKAAQSQAPRIVEVRPEVNVEVGDTNIHNPLPRPEPLAKVAPPVQLRAVRTSRMADGSVVSSLVDKP